MDNAKQEKTFCSNSDFARMLILTVTPMGQKKTKDP